MASSAAAARNVAFVRARISPALKRKAEGVFHRIGLNSTDVIRALFVQAVAYQALPFPMRVPNAETRKALKEAQAGKGRRYKTPAALFKALGI
jgi:DNA-damage-inducible protein J